MKEKKWGNYVILCLNSSGDYAVRYAANAWKARYKVPDTHCFVVGAPLKGYQDLLMNSLRPYVDKYTKLMIFAHGDPAHVDQYDSKTLAGLLRFWGVKEVGLIAIKACEVGKAYYLEWLGHYLGAGSFGWIIGYKASTSTMGKYILFGEAREMTTVSDVLWHFVGRKVADKDRVKIVQGGLHVSVPGKGSRPYYATSGAT